MRKLSLLISSVLLFTTTFAQTVNRCGTTEVMQRLFQEDPTYQGRLQEIENNIQNYSATHSEGTRTVTTIPVVVHVVYKTAAQNISDAQIQSQIDVLNEDFRKLNADAVNVPAVWQSIAADCEINFCLASQDPSGNATSGIIRTSTTKTSFSDNDDVKHANKGGQDAWNRDAYLNIWVANLGSGLLGYAQFPGGPPTTDGVVIKYNAFGRTGNVAAPYNKGRSATHEIGHWFNLFHIWGDDGTSCNGSDNVSDTPNQADETYGCPSPTIRISCTNGPAGDMYVNYMDYTDDACMYMFTAGQKTRMQATLDPVNGSRKLILNSQGCVAPGGTCNVPGGLNATNVTSSSATLNWSVATGATSYNIDYRPVGAGSFTTTTSTTTSKAITGLIASTQYEFQVQSDCGGGTTSAFSPLSNFTTSGTSCTDNFEPNNTKGTAVLITANTNIQGLISSSTDKDWFKFKNSASKPNINVILTNLPADYDLELYDATGSLIVSSENAGTEDESTILNAAAVGTYKVRVFGSGGSFNSSSCYTLNAQISSSPFRTVGPVNTATTSITNLYPNPSKGNMTIEYSSASNGDVQLIAYDMMGRVVFNQLSSSVEGKNTYNVIISNLNPGIYVFEIKSGNEASRSKFSVEQ